MGFALCAPNSLSPPGAWAKVTPGGSARYLGRFLAEGFTNVLQSVEGFLQRLPDTTEGEAKKTSERFIMALIVGVSLQER